jgi:ABC-type transport system substrate-binding protein
MAGRNHRPFAAEMLSWSGVAVAQSARAIGAAVQADAPRRRRPAQDALVAGADAAQSALRRRQKDLDASSLFYEPLAPWDPDANLIPILAPRSRACERRRRARRPSVTWKLKRNVTWHDGKPFTADDVVFTGVRERSGDRGGIERRLQGSEARREGRFAHGEGRVQRTGSVLGAAGSLPARD